MGNFGTVLPIVLGAALVSEVDLGPALLFFGVWYIVMGTHYGIPMSVEPMKAVSVIAISEELTEGELGVSGLILGAALLVLGLGHSSPISESSGLVIQDLLHSLASIGVGYGVFTQRRAWDSDRLDLLLPLQNFAGFLWSGWIDTTIPHI